MDMAEQLDKWRGDATEMILHKVAKIDLVLDNQRRLENAMEKMSDAITKLAVVEERQSSMADAIERLTEALEKFEARLVALEKTEGEQNRAANWAYNAVWGLAGIAVMYVLDRVGIL